LIGGPGSGKSTILYHELWKWASTDIYPQVPVLIELRRYIQDSSAPSDFIDYFARGYSCIHHLDANYLIGTLFSNGDSMLLLDGLDEILDHRRREEVLLQIVRFKNDYPKTRIIVTSRRIGYRKGNYEAWVFENSLSPHSATSRKCYLLTRGIQIIYPKGVSISKSVCSMRLQELGSLTLPKHHFC